MSLDLFDAEGAPVAYSEDGEHIFSFSGEPLAYIVGSSVYGFDGEHLGWFSEGQIRDHQGAVVTFTRGSRGGPLKPLTQLTPLKALRQLMPLKALRQLAPLRPIDSLAWSDLSAEQFFRTQL